MHWWWCAVGIDSIFKYLCVSLQLSQHHHHHPSHQQTGSGAAVMGRSPLIELIALLNHHADFHIMGSCEPYTEAWADGPITLYIGMCTCIRVCVGVVRVCALPLLPSLC